MHPFSESTVESAALSWFEGLGYQVINGPDIAPGEPKAERESYEQVILEDRLLKSIQRINGNLMPPDVYNDAVNKVLRQESPNLAENNKRFHKMLTDGVEVEYCDKNGRVKGDLVKLIDFDRPEKNDWLVVNQFTVVEDKHNRRPDIVVFVNGIPLAIIELKNPADEDATIRGAFKQLQTYKHETPAIFTYNEILAVSDGVEARAGTLTSNWEWFLPWRTIEGDALAPKGSAELEFLVKGIFEKRRILDLIRHFITFEVDGANILKKVAAYHQYHAVNKAVECTLQATSPKGDKRVGVVWHTQGSGKSLSMAFYAGKIVKHPKMDNPTLVVLTDRNDLDEQLFNIFALNKELLRQIPVAAENRQEIMELLKKAAGGVVFTTIQKFFPEEKGGKYPLLSDRRNIVVIADEAHRSQYDFIDGFARHMRDALPNASFIGFTGTPIEMADRSTPAVFGDYIDIYDIQRAIEDGATKAIYYEGRLAMIKLKEEERPKIDPEFEEVTEGEESNKKEKLKKKWARLEAMVGNEKRVAQIAKDIVDHFEKRLDAIEGKGMIVCMSRRICVDLYNEIIKIRPQWHNDDDKEGFIKVVMTGSASDSVEWQKHIRNKERRRALRERFQNDKENFRLAIVRDMWLTGVDIPCLHTMYFDKPMRGHGLMQAIARVNRVYRDKPGGLIVDYLGIAEELKKAMADYTESGGKGKTTIDQAEAVAVMLEKYEIVSNMFHGFDYSLFFKGKPDERVRVIPLAMEHVLKIEKKPEDAKKRFMDGVTALSHAFALSVPHPKALEIIDDVGFFQTVRASIIKTTESAAKSDEQIELAIKQIVSKAIVSDKVVNIFEAAGIKTPDISILSDAFLAEMKGMPQRNLALELLKKLINDEIRARSRKFLVQSKSFADMLEKTIRKYQNRAIEAAQVIEELIALAKEMREANKRGEDLGFTEDELAFYDALEVNDSAVKVLGDEVLQKIAKELVETVRKNVSIDWNVRDSARAKMRVAVKRILKKHGYPPDKQEKATQTVIEQAELLCQDWNNI